MVNDSLSPLLELIKQFEGCHLAPYVCPAGVWTCGWGATGKGVIPGQFWTQEEADTRLEQDATYFLTSTKLLCPGLDGDQLAAIADFAYNLGLGALRGSTLRKRILVGDHEDVPRQLSRWVYGGGRKLNGLVRRRAAEAKLFTSGA